MDTTVSKELETIKQAILDTVNANEIYLFGSYAGRIMYQLIILPIKSHRPQCSLNKVNSCQGILDNCIRSAYFSFN